MTRIPWPSFVSASLTGLALAACASAPAKAPTPTPERPEPREAKPAPHDLAPVSYLPVIRAEVEPAGDPANQTAYAVLPEGDSLAELGKGTPKLVKRDDFVFLVRAVDAAKLSDAQRQWLGGQLVTDTGCAPMIERLALVLRYEPHFDTRMRWNGEAVGDEEPRPRMSDAEIADESVSDFETGSHVLLAAELGPCEGAWARTPDRPTPAAFEAATAEPALEKALLAKFRSLAGWKANQARARESDPRVTTKTWDVWQGAKPVVRLWRGNGRTFAQVTAEAGQSCGEGDFSGSFGALFEVKGDGAKAKLELLTNPDDGPVREVVDVVDIDVDGVVEFLLDDGIITRDGDVWTQTLDIAAPSYDNPC